MTITEKLAKLGSWNLTLDDLPKELFAKLGEFGHVVVVPTDVHNVTSFGDAILERARYTGVLRQIDTRSERRVVLRGSGLGMWLGDEDGKGPVYESSVDFSGAAWSAIQTALNSGDGASGLTHAHVGADPAGTYTGSFQYMTVRQAQDIIAAAFGTTWRVLPNFTFQTGAPADLFEQTPKTLIVRRHLEGESAGVYAADGDLSTKSDYRDYTQRVVLLGQEEDSTVVSGTADNPTEYQRPDGTPMRWVRLVSESGTSSVNAAARAQLSLNRFTNGRQDVKLSTDTHTIISDGRLRVGDMVHVWDEDAGLIDAANPIDYQGQHIAPALIQCVGTTWPVTDEYTVAFRTDDGEWLDLTEYVQFERSATRIEVGDFEPNLFGDDELLYGRVLDAANTGGDDGSIPGQVTIDSLTGGTYQDDQGATLAYVLVDWSQPTNTDLSVITDGSHYEVRWKPTAGGDYSQTAVGFDSTLVELRALAIATGYDIEVRAVDIFGNAGAWSLLNQITTTDDTIPPSTPAAPTVAGSALTVQVIHDLQRSAGGDLERDVDHLEVHYGTSSGFTPSGATLLGLIPVGSGAIALGIDVIGDFHLEETAERWIKVRAVDRAGNVSSASTAANVTIALVDTINIADAAITNLKVSDVSASKLTAGQITSALIELANTGSGLGSIQSEDFVTGVTGFLIDGDGNVEFNSGVFRGTLEAGEVHIPNTTASASAHIDSVGDIWAGANVANKASAPFFVDSATGDVTLNDGDVTGDIVMSGSGAVKTGTTGRRAEYSALTTSASYIIYTQDFSGLDFYGGDPQEVEPGILGIAYDAGGDDTYMMLAPPAMSAGTRTQFLLQMIFNSTSTETRISDSGRLYLLNGSAAIDMTGGTTEVRELMSTDDIRLKVGHQLQFTDTGNYIHHVEGTSGIIDEASRGYFEIRLGGTRAMALGWHEGDGANRLFDNDAIAWTFSENNDGFAYDPVDEVGASFHVASNPGGDADFYWNQIGNVSTANSRLDLVPSYGTIACRPDVSQGQYGGINIDGEFVLMGNGSSYGLYDDRNQSWLYVTTAPNSGTLDNNTAALLLEADAGDTDLDYQFFYATPNVDSGGGSDGDAVIQFCDEMGGTTGTTAVLGTVTTSGITGKRLRFSSSHDNLKDTPEDWSLSTEAFMRIRPRSFHFDDMYVDDEGRHHGWDGTRALDAEHLYDPPPTTWVPLKRAGFMWSELMTDDELMMLCTDLGIHEQAMLAALVDKVQMILEHLELAA